MELNGKVCVVTGAMSGIGRETAELVAGRGGLLVLGDLTEIGSRELVDSLGGEAQTRFVRADVTVQSEVERLIDTAVAVFGRIDVLVNSAGIGSRSKIPDITGDEWDRVMAVNLKSVFLCSQRAMYHMERQKRGTIISISSASAKIGGIAVGAHYSASKAGVICLTKSLALYGAPFGVTANSVCPGPTITPLTDAWGDALNAEFAAKIPLKRYATPREVAETVCFLASEGAAYITGETIDVNGGLVMD